MKIDKGTVAWNGLMNCVAAAIKEWVPKPFKTELEYRDSLMRFLRECAPGARIEAEYRHSGTTADIYFKWEGFLSTGEIFIELKRNLRQKPQLDRLIGQLEQLDPGKHKIIVVLCGKTNETLLSRLKKNTGDIGKVWRLKWSFS